MPIKQVQPSLVLVGHSQVVESGGVRRVDFSGALPSVDRFPPQPFLRNVDAESNLRAALKAFTPIEAPK